jgi:hypothetical protein
LGQLLGLPGRALEAQLGLGGGGRAADGAALHRAAEQLQLLRGLAEALPATEALGAMGWGGLAAALVAGTTQYGAVAFEHAGRTYLFEQGDTTATYAPGVDLLVELVGVTGVTALSTTASAANTVWVR